MVFLNSITQYLGIELCLDEGLFCQANRFEYLKDRLGQLSIFSNRTPQETRTFFD